MMGELGSVIVIDWVDKFSQIRSDNDKWMTNSSAKVVSVNRLLQQVCELLRPTQDAQRFSKVDNICDKAKIKDDFCGSTFAFISCRIIINWLGLDSRQGATTPSHPHWWCVDGESSLFVTFLVRIFCNLFGCHGKFLLLKEIIHQTDHSWLLKAPSCGGRRSLGGSLIGQSHRMTMWTVEQGA